MEGKAKYIFPAFMSGVMAFLMTGFVTALNLGFPPNFVAQWMRAFVLAWPLAYLSALVAMPLARRATAYVVARIDGRAG
jgi:hypothetical protein